MANPKAAEALLGRSTPVTDVLRPYAAGEQDWPTTLERLSGLTYTDRPKATADDLLGRTEAGRERYADSTIPAPLPDEGSWGEVVAARDVGILTAAQLAEALATPQRS